MLLCAAFIPHIHRTKQNKFKKKKHTRATLTLPLPAKVLLHMTSNFFFNSHLQFTVLHRYK